MRLIYHLLKRLFNSAKEKIQNYKLKNFYRQFIGKSHLFFDIGANIGEKTKMFNKLGNKVVTVEPQSSCIKILEKKFANNSDIIIVQKGVRAAEGKSELNISSRYHGFSSFDKEWQKGTKYYTFDQVETAETTTLESLIKQYGLPDFCKIDVEGDEPEVLAGLQTKISCLSFEFHGNNFSLAKKCLDRLENLGYQSFNFVINEGTFVLKDWVSKTKLIKRLENEVKINNNIWGDIYAK